MIFFFNLQIRGPLALTSYPLPSPIEMIRKENHFGPPDSPWFAVFSHYPPSIALA